MVTQNVVLDLEAPPLLPSPIDIDLLDESFSGIGAFADEVMLPDGSVIIDLSPRRAASQSDDFYANLAEEMSESDLGLLASDLLQGIESDDQSRATWLSTRARGLDLLGLKLNDPRSDLGSGALEGMSTVYHPVVLEATLRFQANARGELLPASGPVKVRNDGEGGPEGDAQAEALEEEMNHYITVTASEYVPDTDRMFFLLGFGGIMFKKVYRCPIRNRPVSESVDAKDVIVSNASTDIANAGRVTHRISMRRSILKRMQLLGAYRNIDLMPLPDAVIDAVRDKIQQIQGTSDPYSRPEDRDYTIYECYAELDLPGYEHTDEEGKETGLPLPYKISIDVTSQQILEIRRNWRKDDEMQTAKKVLIPWIFIPGLGFYGMGFVNILGNPASALTGAWRILLDAGMFNNFPGFLYAKTGETRQKNNNFRVPPGGGAPVDTSGQKISDVIMPLPYKGPDATMMALTESISQVSARLGGTAEIQVGEGRQDAPVGTTLAMIEQAVQVMNAVHKRLCTAQSEEFQALRDLFLEDPAPLVRCAKNKKRPGWNEERVLAALENCDIVPVADPNTPSHLHRIMKAMALKQIQQSNPNIDPDKVDQHILAMLNIDSPEQFFRPPVPPVQMQPDPIEMGKLQVTMEKNQIAAQKIAQDFQKALLEYNSDIQKTKDSEDIEILKFARDVARDDSNKIVAMNAARRAESVVRG